MKESYIEYLAELAKKMSIEDLKILIRVAEIRSK